METRQAACLDRPLRLPLFCAKAAGPLCSAAHQSVFPAKIFRDISAPLDLEWLNN
jgi:hypothetical protein